MSRRSRKHRSSRRKFPLLTAAAVAVPFIDAGINSGLLGTVSKTTVLNFGANICRNFTGYNPINRSWHPESLVVGYGPIVTVKLVKIGMKILGTRLPSIGPVALA